MTKIQKRVQLRGLARVGVAFGLVALTSFSFMGSANAATDTAVIRKVDTATQNADGTTQVQVSVLKPLGSSTTDSVSVTENGKKVANPKVQNFGEASVQTGTVLLLDSTQYTIDGAVLDKEKAAAIAMVNAKAPGQKFAIVSFNNTVQTVVDLTDNPATLIAGINTLQSSGQAALWDGVAAASSLLDGTDNIQRNIVLVTTSPDLRSTAKADDALANLRSSKATLFPIIVQQHQAIETSGLRSVASGTGGPVVTMSDSDGIADAMSARERALTDQKLITYTTSDRGALDITVNIGSASAVAHVNTGTVAEGSDVAPTVVKTSSLPGFLNGYTGLAVIGLIALAGFGLLAYGAVELIGNERNQLSRALRPYSDDPSEDVDLSRIADSHLIKKAIAETASFADKRGLLVVVQSRLEQADLPLKPAEAIFFTAVIALVAMIVFGLLFGILGLGFAGLVFAYMPIFITNMMAKLRRRKFTGQLPDTLQLLAGSLRAGYSLVQGLDAVAKQTSAPMATELQRAMSEARLGRPVEDALQEVSDRMGSDDFEWAVMAIRIQREVGGNLAELLVTVSETMIARERLRREVRALTAEGRVSAIILAILPVAIGILISIMNPTYMKPMFAETIGQIALVVAAILIVVGYFLMTKLIEVEV